MTLQSKLFTDPDPGKTATDVSSGRDLLQGCEVNDRDHFKRGEPDRVGRFEAVSRIQRALAILGFTITDPVGLYEGSTAQAVATFKRNHKPPILNFKGEIDDIVGKKTIGFLDAEMLKRQPPTPAPVVPPAPAPQLFLDFVIRFRAGEQREPLAEIKTAEYDKKKATRILEAIRGDSTGPGDAALVTKVADAIDTKLKETGRQLGIICIFGNSNGGRNAVELAQELAKRKRPIKFVGLADAALNEGQGLLLNTPTIQALTGVPTNVPRWTPSPAFTATVKQNFFQSVGNSAIRPLRDPRRIIWDGRSRAVGGIPGEFHGQVDGFEATPGGQQLTPLDSTKSVHVDVADRGDSKNAEKITELLAALPTDASGQ